VKLTKVDIYQVVVASARGSEYRATLLTWPTLKDIQRVIETEVASLKKAAHFYDDLLDPDTQHKVGCLWERVEELTTLLEMFRLLGSNDDPQQIPYQKNIVVGGKTLGYITVSSTPAWQQV
jgi:hypothetical protein